jgi:transmembrane protein DUF3566
MSRRDRSDAAAPAETDTPDSPAASANGDAERQLPRPAGSSASPTESAAGNGTPDRNGPPTPHELLEPDSPKPTVGKPDGPKPDDGGSQVISGDPLLRAPGTPPPVEAKKKAQSPAPPSRPPSAALPARPVASDPARPSTSHGALAPGVGPPSTGQPTRRASRGAHVAAPREAVPAVRPSQERPVTTLRPTTVAPVPRLAGRRPRVRRVTRVVRHVDPWSVFKVAAAFSVVAYAIALVAGVLLWNVAYATGTIDNIERGMESTGWEVFELDGGEIFHNAWIGGLFAAVALTGLAVLVATLFNLITDLVGGVRLTVLEEEVVEKTASPMRRFATAPAPRPAPVTQETAPGQTGAQARIRRARGE